MRSRLKPFCLALLTLALAATPALGAPRTTVERTIQDRDGDNLLEPAPGEDYTVVGDDEDFRPPRQGSLLNFLQLSDFQMVDEESPGRVEFLDGSQRIPGLNPFSAAYRPQESLTTQVTEAMVRQVRNTTSPLTGERLDLAILTGDNADSQQYNETRWFIDILDGTTGAEDPDPDMNPPVGGNKIDPNSGVEGTCDTTPDGSIYDGVHDNGVAGPNNDNGYYEPDASDGQDGDNYTPRPQENQNGVRVRDFPGLFEDAQRPFEAHGLDMPWYSAFGNHDALVQGNAPEAFAGPFGPSGETLNPVGYDSIVRGCLKPSRLPAFPPTVENPDEEFLENFPGNVTEANSTVVPRDDRRCYLAKDAPIGAAEPCKRGWIAEHSRTSGFPTGHGFEPFAVEGQNGTGRPAPARINHDGYYSFKPRAGVRFIVLDTVTDECGALVCAEGSVDEDQYEWAKDEIEAAAGMDEYVLLFSHHTERTTRFPSIDETEWNRDSARPTDPHYGERFDRKDGPPRPIRPDSPDFVETLEDLFCASPNVLGHVAGHEHENYVLEHKCEDPGQGSNRYFEISTAAHIDWPQQARMIELLLNEDRTLSLALTILDHDGPPNPGGSKGEVGGGGSSGDSVQRLASIGREIAYNDYQGSRSARGGAGDRNVLIKTARPWPYAPPSPPGG